jgi:hypothetical protein
VLNKIPTPILVETINPALNTVRYVEVFVISFVAELRLTIGLIA